MRTREGPSSNMTGVLKKKRRLDAETHMADAM